MRVGFWAALRMKLAFWREESLSIIRDREFIVSRLASFLDIIPAFAETTHKVLLSAARTKGISVVLSLSWD